MRFIIFLLSLGCIILSAYGFATVVESHDPNASIYAMLFGLGVAVGLIGMVESSRK